MNAELITAAEAYHRQGLAIIPFYIGTDGKKHPSIDAWKKWQTTKQTLEDFKSLHIEEYGMFGVVCGTAIIVDNEQVFLVGVDRDVKDEKLPAEVKQKSLEAIKRMPVTHRERTPSGGNHLLYYSRKQVASHKPSKTGMELQAIGCLMVMAPSEGYSLENNNQITIVDDAEALFFKTLQEVGLYQPPTQPTTPNFKPTTQPRPCITEALKQQLTGGNGHLMRLAIAAEYKRLGYTEQQIVELFRESQQDFRIDRSMDGVSSADPSKAATCNSIREYGYCLPDCPLKHSEMLITQNLKSLALDETLEDRLLTDIHRTIKNDDVVVCDTFHAGLSAYFDPYNLAHKAKSGAGKTYTTTGTIDYFPEEDVIIIGSQSPKVISHDYGELITLDESGKETPLNLDEAPQKPMRREFTKKEDYQEALAAYKKEKKIWDTKIKNSFHLIQLAGKIYVFLDTISRETFEMFKCTLSHDKQRITHRFVDDKGNVRTTVLDGWPAAIFCTVDQEFMEEFATRTFTDTPETNKEKIQASQEVTDNKKSYPWEFEQESDEKKLFKTLIRIIRDVVKEHRLKIVKPFPNMRHIIEFSNENTRDMRDYEHFNQLLPTYTAFRIFQRPIITINKQKYVVESINDVLAALCQFDKIAETTRTSTEKTILDFYHNHVQQHKDGAVLKDLLANAPEMKSERTARYYLSRLEELGYVNIVEGKQSDKRLLTYYPIQARQEILQTTANKRNTADLRLKLQEDFNLWLETITAKNPSMQIEKLEIEGKTLIQTSIEELKKFIGVTDITVAIVSNEEKKLIQQKKDEKTAKTVFTAVSPKSTATTPMFFYKDIPTGEKCEACGEQAVTREITSPQDETLRRCDNCFNELQVLFSKAIWQAEATIPSHW